MQFHMLEIIPTVMTIGQSFSLHKILWLKNPFNIL